MIKKILSIFSAASAIAFTTGAALGDTVVSGAVRGNWTVQGGAYIVTGSIWIANNDTLVIDPGVRVIFNQGTQFDVYGILNARGEERDSILFVGAARQPGFWRWIKFDGVRTRGSTLDYCIISNTEWGLIMTNADPIVRHSNIIGHLNACVRFDGSLARMTDCSVSASGRSGIYIEGSARPIIEGTVVARCSGNGIVVSDNSTPTIRRSYIGEMDESGIYLNAAGACSLNYNTITGNGNRGVYIFQSDNPILLRNIIFQNRGTYGVFVHRSQNLSFIGNTIYGNTGTGVQMVGSSAQIINNIIATSTQFGLYAQDSNLSLGYNDVWGNSREDYQGIDPGQSDISADPQLMNPGILDFRPREGSPVIDAGDMRYRDADGTRADIGAEFFNQNHPPEIVDFSPQQLERVDGDTQVEFWVSVRDPDGHHVDVYWTLNADTVARDTIITLHFDRDGQFVVRALANDLFFMGEASHEWRFTVEGSAAPASGNAAPTTFHLSDPYPNPFNGRTRLHVESPYAGAGRIILRDLQGGILQDFYLESTPARRREFSIDAGGLPAGTYMLSVESGGFRGIKKLVLIR